MLKKILLASTLLIGSAHAQQCDDFTNVDVRKLRSQDTLNLCEFKDKPLLIVNTASNCGFTGQFEGLEQLHKDYKDKGLVILGFPSDDFFQEEDDEKETAKVCYINYGVTFQMFATSSVRGSDANPIFQHLNAETSSPKWNFYKYLVSADRKTVQRFNSRTKPQSEELIAAIEKVIQ